MENVIERVKNMGNGDVVKYYTGHFGSQGNIGSDLHRFIMGLMYTPYYINAGNKKQRDEIENCDYICYQKLVKRNVSSSKNQVTSSVFDYFIKKIK